MGKKLIEESRDCAYCQHWRLCFVYKGVQAALQGVHILNFSTSDTPGRVGDIYIALARACTEFEPQQVETEPS